MKMGTVRSRDWEGDWQQLGPAVEMQRPGPVGGPEFGWNT